MTRSCDIYLLLTSSWYQPVPILFSASFSSTQPIFFLAASSSSFDSPEEVEGSESYLELNPELEPLKSKVFLIVKVFHFILPSPYLEEPARYDDVEGSSSRDRE